MSWVRRHRPSPATGIALAALVVAFGGAAFAAIPDPDGTIHACYEKKDGDLRVVEAASKCGKRERPLDWNKQQQASAAYPPGNANSTHPDPPPNPTGTVVETRVSLAQPGRLLVTGSLDAEKITCASGPQCQEQFGLYVDGSPLPRTGSRSFFVTTGGSSTHFQAYQDTLMGRSSVLSAGEHVVTLSRTLFSGSATFSETLASVDAEVAAERERRGAEHPLLT